jgi:hypothetical protein
MHTVTLICTIHNAVGNCNSFELYKIIEKIQPDIIFEELPLIVYDDCYIHNRITLETSAVKEYIRNHPIKHIPVDTFDKKHDRHKVFENMNSIIVNSSVDCRNYLDKLIEIETYQGFNFLNSKQCDIFFDNFSIMQERVLNFINDNNLTQIYKEEKEYHNNRENEMINNIYNYSKNNNYNSGIFFIGSGHRKSIIRKLYQHKRTADINIQWKVYKKEPDTILYS